MKIIEKIKEIIARIFKPNLKMIEAHKEYNEDIDFSNKKIEEINYRKEIIVPQEKKIKTKEESIREILIKIGCENEIFEKIDISKIEVENFRKNINILLKYKYTKLEFSKIITQNSEILYIENMIILEKINELENVLKEEKIIKEIIYNNPYILTQEMNIKDIIKIFEKYEIDTEKQFYIFKQNTSLFDLSVEKIERSLKNISEVIKNKVEFIKTLISEPILVGIEDKEIINNILNGEM